MHLIASPLERWFTSHPGPHRHSLASTALAAPGWDAVSGLLSAEWNSGLSLGYSEPAGDPELRAMVAADYGVAPERVILTQGAVEANWLALASVVEPGDRVVVQMPVYPQLPLVAAALGAEVVAWRFEASALMPLVDARTRLVVLNSPHNPTGAVVPEETMSALVEWLDATPGALVLVDEVYRGVGDAVLPASASGLHERVMVTSSTSKAWALPGLRVGWLVAPEPVVVRATEWREHTGLALSSLSEAFLKGIWERRKVLIDANQGLMRRNRGVVERWLARHPQLSGTPAATAGCFLLKPPEGFDDLAACEQWFQEGRVLMIPGATIGYPGTLRVGYGQRDPEVLEAALAYLSGRL
jgi:aspartate/methionine/tyrosine aminotransferase